MSGKNPKRFERLADFGRDFQGYGARQTTHVRALKGSKLGAANKGRRLDPLERRAIERQMRKEGKL